jgi:hypothetical protein
MAEKKPSPIKGLLVSLILGVVAGMAIESQTNVVKMILAGLGVME